MLSAVVSGVHLAGQCVLALDKAGSRAAIAARRRTQTACTRARRSVSTETLVVVSRSQEESMHCCQSRQQTSCAAKRVASVPSRHKRFDFSHRVWRNTKVVPVKNMHNSRREIMLVR